MKMPLGLVEDWRKCWRWNSQQVAVIAAIFNAVAHIPIVFYFLSWDTIATVNGLFSVLIILARLRDQPNA